MGWYAVKIKNKTNMLIFVASNFPIFLVLFEVLRLNIIIIPGIIWINILIFVKPDLFFEHLFSQ